MADRLAPTEQRNPLSMHLDELSTLEMVRLMNQLDATIAPAIAEVLPPIANVVDAVAQTLDQGGRLFYQGAGTSGRLAVLDAAELLPTFRAPPGLVIGLIAGGSQAMVHSVEGAEDSRDQGKGDLIAHAFAANDMLIGVAASGRTPYVLGGLDYANFPKLTVIENKMNVDEMVLVRKIDLSSTCEHHFVTIDGAASVAYIPRDKVIGLSKINRVVRFFAQRPQVQERLTEQVLRALQALLDTRDVAVSITAVHYCVKARGVMDANSETTTTALGGAFRNQPATRKEFLVSIGR